MSKPAIPYICCVVYKLEGFEKYHFIVSAGVNEVEALENAKYCVSSMYLGSKIQNVYIRQFSEIIASLTEPNTLWHKMGKDL